MAIVKRVTTHTDKSVEKWKPWCTVGGNVNCRHEVEKANAPHSSVLAWEIPGMGEPGGLPSMGSHRVGHD